MALAPDIRVGNQEAMLDLSWTMKIDFGKHSLRSVPGKVEDPCGRVVDISLATVVSMTLFIPWVGELLGA